MPLGQITISLTSLEMQSCLANMIEMPVGYVYEPAFAHLPCYPFSADWREQENVITRGVLSALLTTAGYGRGKGG